MKRPAHRPAADPAEPITNPLIGFRPSTKIRAWLEKKRGEKSMAAQLREIVEEAYHADQATNTSE